MIFPMGKMQGSDAIPMVIMLRGNDLSQREDARKRCHSHGRTLRIDATSYGADASEFCQFLRKFEQAVSFSTAHK